MSLEQTIIDERKEFLNSWGLDADLMESLLPEGQKLPPIETCRESLEFLIENVYSDSKYIQNNPMLLAKNKQTLQAKFDYITKELGLDIKTFEKLPALFNLSIEDNLKPKVEYITKELGLDIKTFEKLPALFSHSIEENLKPKVEYITKELGLDIKTFEKLPSLFGFSIEENLKPKVEYITKELGLNIKTFEKLPTLFSYSLEGRIKPRVEFVALKGKDWQIQSYMSQSDEKFCYKLGCSLEEYEQFKKDRLNPQ